MKLSAIIDMLAHITGMLRIAFVPTLRDILRKPALLLSPVSISRTFFAYVWVPLGPGLDENGRPTKKKLITPNAHGVVLDIGAGYGHSVDYLDRARVTCYVALEPNALLHPHIRERAGAAGYSEADGSFILLPYGAEDTTAITSALGGAQRVNTLLAVLTLCSVPEPQRTISSLVCNVLGPRGTLLFYEHVLSPRADVAWWQRFWTPIWRLVLDGCSLDRPTNLWIEQLQDVDDDGIVASVWSEGESWGDEGLDEHLFWHRVGKFVKKL